MTPDDWFDFGDEQSRNGIQSQVVDVPQAFSSPPPSMSPLPQQQQVGFGEKRRHLFTVHSGNNWLVDDFHLITALNCQTIHFVRLPPQFRNSLSSSSVLTGFVRILIETSLHLATEIVLSFRGEVFVILETVEDGQSWKKICSPITLNELLVQALDTAPLNYV